MEFALQTGGMYEDVLDHARWAVDAGLVAVAIPDHYLLSADEDAAAAAPARDAFALLAGLARDTSDVELGVLVSPITFRHPAVLLKSAVTIHEMSGGRFVLGLGTGWLDIEHRVFGFAYPNLAERFELLEEALAYVRAGLDPFGPGFRGQHFTLAPFPLRPVPDPMLRIVVGGTGRTLTPRLAGLYADELNAYPAAPDVFAEKVQVMRTAASEAGRDPDAIRVSSSGQLLCAPTEAEYRDKLAEQASRSGTSVDELEAYYRHRSTPRGTYDQVATQLAGLEAAGATRFYIQRSASADRGEDEALLAVLR